MQDDPIQVVLGPPEHGVTRYARQLADAGGGPVQVQRQLVDAAPPAAPYHLQLTPQLVGPTPEEAAERLVEWCARSPARPTITLHDLPQPSDGAQMFPRRAACVRRWLGLARAVAVSSAHEAALVREFAPEAAPTVLPLPVDPPPDPLPPAPDGSLGVLGFIYPGKGHQEAIGAAAGREPRPPVRFLGAPSPGHEDLVAELRGTADRADVPLEVTGHLDEADWAARIARVGVPLALHRHLSASGSINSWVAHRRRPLVLRSSYAEELAALRPGTLQLIEVEEIDDAVAAALADPRRTVLPADLPLGPDTAATLTGYRRFWAAAG